ncbi:MAG: PD-(D/E)XK nuclease family transposase [Lachnospiraceae bacterium]|nr:PD-(D/E)XK nuclease family transposase [Lachnospiraceae bacterium]
MNCEEYASRVKLLNPMDDDLFKKMAEDVDFCQEIIRVILGAHDLQVLEVRDQHSVKNLQGRSVILDVLCINQLGEYITVEVQKSDDDNHQKRVRYNSSCVTANITEPGSKFENVPELCSIYISKSDFFGKGKTVYHVDRVLRETGDVVDNGFCEIYVNARVRDDTPVSELMAIFTQDDAYDDHKFPATSRRKRHFKEGQEGANEMSKIMDEIREDGIAEGIERGRRQLILLQYREGDITLQRACSYLHLSEEQFLELERQND